MSAPPICALKHPRHPFWVCTHPAGHLGPHEALGVGNGDERNVLAEWPSEPVTNKACRDSRLDRCEQAILEIAATLREAGITPARSWTLPSPSGGTVSASQSADPNGTITA